MKGFFKRLFCRHHYMVTGPGEPLGLFGIALWGTWDAKCTKCGKIKLGMDYSSKKADTTEYWKKVHGDLQKQLDESLAKYHKSMNYKVGERNDNH